MATKAYSYIRFSSAPQEFGDSIRRQTEKRDQFIAESTVELELDTSLDMTDKGLSAFDGSNVEKGALGAFLQAVKIGRVQKGSYLLIENLDRLSRQSLDKSMFLLLDILRSGIHVVTLSDRKIIKAGELGITDMIPVMVELERAHKESTRKSQLIGDAWANKKNEILEKESHKKLTKWCPKWLKLAEDRTYYEVNDFRVSWIKQILRWMIEGYGTSRIIQKLEDEGVEPWSSNSGVKSEKRVPKQWRPNMIQRLVDDRSLIGEFKLKRTNPDTKKTEFITIKDYFPNVLKGEENLLFDAQKSRQKRNVVGPEKRGTGNRGETVSNLFAGLAVCGYSLEGNSIDIRCAGDNVSMVYANKGKGAQYLQCESNKNGNSGCKECSKLWRYDHFETAFLRHVEDIDATSLLGSDEDIEGEVSNLERDLRLKEDELKEVKIQINNINETVSDLLKVGSVPRFYSEKLHELQILADELPKNIDSLEIEIRSLRSDENNPGLIKTKLADAIDLMSNCKNSQELFKVRLGLSELIGKVVDRIEVYSKGNFFNERMLQKMLEKFPEKMADQRLELETYLRNREEEAQRNDKRGRRHIGFFIVRYKSGESRLIRHHPLDPEYLTTSVKYDKDQKIIARDDNRYLENMYLKSVKSKDSTELEHLKFIMSLAEDS